MSDRAHTRGRERPILFSAPMVRALLAGTKTQTRRVLKPQPQQNSAGLWCATTRTGSYQLSPDFMPMIVKISVGDRLWVREAHYLTDDGDYERAVCAVDADEVREHLATVERLKASHPQVDWSRHARLRPGIHMPRWASRLTLTVTDVRVQRLQDISEEDARAEGVATFAEGRTMRSISDAEIYRLLWEEINGSGSWDSNPWVAVYDFRVHRCNIDQMEAA